MHQGVISKSFEANRNFAFARAETVRVEIAGLVDNAVIDATAIHVKSYGELNSVNYNTDFTGQRLNRRIEEWVRKQKFSTPRTAIYCRHKTAKRAVDCCRAPMMI